MKIFLSSIIICIALVACDKAESDSGSELQSLYAQLDSEIARSKEYEQVKEERIARLKKNYDLGTDHNHRTAIINSLIEEYDAYNADSALYYISYNLQRHAVREIPGEYTRLMIKRADVFAHAGLFADALFTLRSIPADSVTDALKEAYYSTYCATYQYLSEYTDNHETAPGYIRQRDLYTDSLNMVINPESFNHQVYVMTQLAREGARKRL